MFDIMDHERFDEWIERESAQNDRALRDLEIMGPALVGIIIGGMVVLLVIMLA